MIVKAINPKYQTLVNKAVIWAIKYNEYNTSRNAAYDNLSEDIEYEEDCKIWRKFNRLCENSWDKYQSYLDELPSRERSIIDRWEDSYSIEC